MRFVDTSKQRGDYMRKAKIAVVLAICVGTVMLLSGCGKPYSSYKLSDYIKVGDYKGLKVEKYKVAVSDKEINKEINTWLKAAATTQSIKSGKVKNGDTVVIEIGRASCRERV